MTTTSSTSSSGGPDAAGSVRSAGRRTRLTPILVLRSEWIKQVSLRSVLATTAAVFIVIVGFGLLAAVVSSGEASTPSRGPSFANGDPLNTVLTGAFFAVLIVAVLGVMAGAREYRSGMIRTTFTVVPRRLTVYLAKVAALSALVLPVIAAGVLAVFAGGMAVLRSAGAESLAWGDDGVPRAVVGMIGYLWGIGLLGIAIGFLLRNVAGGLAVLLGGLVFLPTLLSALLPDVWDEVLKYLPSNAGAAFTSFTQTEGTLSVGEGIAVYSAWVVLALVAAAIALKVRDV
jgi:ABC-2 type transport system permease protein